MGRGADDDPAGVINLHGVADVVAAQVGDDRAAGAEARVAGAVGVEPGDEQVGAAADGEVVRRPAVAGYHDLPVRLHRDGFGAAREDGVVPEDEAVAGERRVGVAGAEERAAFERLGRAGRALRLTPSRRERVGNDVGRAVERYMA